MLVITFKFDIMLQRHFVALAPRKLLLEQLHYIFMKLNGHSFSDATGRAEILFSFFTI